MSNDKTNENNQSLLIALPKARLSYPRLDKPYRSPKFPTSDPAWQTEVLIPKSEDITKIKAAMAMAATKKWGAREKWPQNMKSPLKDGDAHGAPEYAGCWYAVAKNKKRPPRLIAADKTVLPASAFYGGCWVHVAVSVYGWDMPSSMILFGLEGVQFVADGDRFGGGGDCTDLFENLADGSDNPESYEAPADDKSPF